MKNAVLISAQFLVELPKNVAFTEAEDYGVDWLSSLNTDALDYRHIKMAGVYLRPVPVQIKHYDNGDIFKDDNLIQL